MEMTREDYRKEVQMTSQNSDIALAVFDIIDFEGSFDDEILDVLREMDSIVIINKVDLIPGGKHASEVAFWVKERLAEEGIVPLDIAIVSAKNTYGINGIIRKLNHFYPKGAKAMVLGTTNVGKSSIINRLLGEKKVTISKYPGTTLKSTKNMIPNTRITLIDTPGLIPQGRISDLVCEECHLKIVPSKEISRKTFKLKAEKIILIGGMVKLRVLTDSEIKPIFSIFASKNVTFHDTKEERVEDLLREHTGTLITPPCDKCKDEFYNLPTKTEVFTIDTSEELVFKGLGWISVKRGPLKVEVTLPEESELIVRDAFIQPKREG
jgi:ribosome biogenesis GTPase YqeH